MKKSLIIICFSCIVISCGNQNNNTPIQEAPKDVKAQVSESEKGLELVAKSDCFTCHDLNAKLVGPPYYSVAERYTATDEVLDTLSQKIIAGGSGRWGDVPMTAHPKLSKQDATIMVKYILSLKK